MSSNKWDNTRTLFKKDLIDLTHPFHKPVCLRDSNLPDLLTEWGPQGQWQQEPGDAAITLGTRGQRALWDISHFSPFGSFASLSKDRSRTPAVPSSLGPLLQSTPRLELHQTRPALLPRPTEAAYVPETALTFQNKAGPGQACGFRQRRFCPNAFHSHL